MEGVNTTNAVQCSKCGTNNPRFFINCKKCGKKLDLMDNRVYDAEMEHKTNSTKWTPTTLFIFAVVFGTLFYFGLKFLGVGNHEKSSIVPPGDKPSQEDIAVQKIDSTTYEILVTNHQPAVENFHVLLKTGKHDKVLLQDFVDKFRKEFCNRKCNISIYDDKSIKFLTTKYPLTDKEYLKFADHFVATSTFEMNDVSLYPFQDIKYKELGGKNWKKEPIKSTSLPTTFIFK